MILDRPGLDRAAVYRAFGQAVDSLQGRYLCGPDVGTGVAEMDWVREFTNFANDSRNDASESTARGVLAGIRACLAHDRATRAPSGGAPGAPSPPGASGASGASGAPCGGATGASGASGASGVRGVVRCVVQGVGGVGARVARALDLEHAVTVADVNPSAVAAMGLPWVEADHVLSATGDLFVPCAVGPVVTAKNVAELTFRMVCGSANTQLESDDLADALAARGVVYAPDFVVNAGAVIEGVLVALSDGPDVRARIDAAIAEIEGRVASLLWRAGETGRTPLSLALEEAWSARR